jgi:hypothetical protein
MYKRIIYKSVLVLALVLSCSSCNKYLTTLPQDGIIREEFWQNKEQVQSAIIGCYASLLSGYKTHSLAETLFLWGELRGDNVSPGTTVNIDESNILQGNILPTNTITEWGALYDTINLCNTFIKYAPNVVNIDKTLTQDKLNAYMSEAYALRALLYFYLVRSFGDVPLKLTAVSSDADLVQLTTTKQADVLKQIVADLTIAEKTAVYTYGDRASDKGRITRYTVNAIQADVYLWMEDYTNCIASCDKIINSGQFGYVAGDSGFFTTLYYNGNSNESIFEFQFDNQALNTFYYMTSSGAPRLLANPNVLANVFPIDVNNPDNADIRSNINVNIGNSYIWKYESINYRTARTPDISYQHWIVYRYADVTLMKAEALLFTNRADKFSVALSIIKDVRRRANAVSSTEQTFDASDPNLDPLAVSLYVMAERDRELMYEGKRWYDILRNAKRNNYANINILLDIVAQSAPAGSQQSILNKYKDHNSHYFPINYTEILNDPNLVQNPFYK